MSSVNVNTHTGPSFTIGNRTARLLWEFVYLFLFRFSPKPLHPWRSFLLRVFGAKIGRGVHVYPKVKIWAPWNLSVGDYSGIANGVILYSQGRIDIGRYVVVSQGSHLCTGTHDYQLKGFSLYTRPIIIKDNVWVAAEVFIHPGVTIGEGCVIGARSLVASSMPAWKVCSGHPCKPLKERVLK
ncbi:MAG: colanic acid biosynthesis acetyltransferase WcaF [Ferruginibacter sp.]|nr:colanic acid biosynthesis acetyltransferase WcaF [Ferruginibacter sp.]